MPRVNGIPFQNRLTSAAPFEITGSRGVVEKQPFISHVFQQERHQHPVQSQFRWEPGVISDERSGSR